MGLHGHVGPYLWGYIDGAIATRGTISMGYIDRWQHTMQRVTEIAMHGSSALQHQTMPTD